MNDRILFILKAREGYWGGYSGCTSSGLSNSVRFIVDMLLAMNIDAHLVEVIDNNDIDRVVTQHAPTHVIIEAFWVVPEKFDQLQALHPGVSWIVRNHSEVPFLANEGIAFGWIAGYLKRGVEVMCNAPRAVKDVRGVAWAYGLSDRLVTYGPNFYPDSAPPSRAASNAAPAVVNVGCFGAIRPLKNHMTQALAALAFARQARLKLAFHINATRLEGNGDPILKNLREMFAATPQHTLVEHAWLPHAEFLDLVAGMDLVLQVSFSETFNIVAADAASVGVPVVVSNELPWIGSYAHADPANTQSIAAAMLRVSRLWWTDRLALIRQQRRDLVDYGAHTEAVWRGRFAAQAV